MNLEEGQISPMLRAFLHEKGIAHARFTGLKKKGVANQYSRYNLLPELEKSEMYASVQKGNLVEFSLICKEGLIWINCIRPAKQDGPILLPGQPAEVTAAPTPATVTEPMKEEPPEEPPHVSKWQTGNLDGKGPDAVRISGVNYTVSPLVILSKHATGPNHPIEYIVGKEGQIISMRPPSTGPVKDDGPAIPKQDIVNEAMLKKVAEKKLVEEAKGIKSEPERGYCPVCGNETLVDCSTGKRIDLSLNGSPHVCKGPENKPVETAVTTIIQQHPAPAQSWDPAELNLVKATVAKGCTDTEFEFLMYLAKTYGLDPLRRQIWAVKYGTAPATIFTGRDGYLEIAHRSGQFDGMESGVRVDPDGETVGWCKVYRKDMTHAFYVEVYLKEYTTGRNLWSTKPRVMLQKVAESQCLRRAFSISGLYSPEEFATESRQQEATA